jgi:hypothetical protein
VELYRWPVILRVRGSRTRKSDALLVIHDVQMVALVGPRPPAPAVMLKHCINVMAHLNLPALLAHQLFDPLPSRVIEVLHMHRGLCAFGLGAEGLHQIGALPFEMA